MNHLKIIGIHVHSRSQELHADILKGYYKRMLTLANRFQVALGYKIKFVNMGSGLGIPYSIKDKPLDTSSLGESTAKLISAFKKDLPGVRIFLETGRYAVGKSGYYITKVLDKKTSMGTTFVILSNTLNGFIRPCLAQLVTRYTTDENPMGSEPLFTAKDAFQFIALTNETEQETVTLVGNLCTATDVVAKDIPLPKLKQGDLVVITNAGSYAAVLSPTQFSSQNPPAQLFLACDGTVTDVTEKL